jgi:hypothetical protein
MKLIIAGSRGFNDYNFLSKQMKKRFFYKDEFFDFHCINEIVSGTAKGADTLGEHFAIKNCIDLVKFKPNWKKYGKKAGMVRNEQMAKYADALICFWNGESKGSKHMIDCMKILKKEIYVELYSN